jgi:hypothetical protein
VDEHLGVAARGEAVPASGQLGVQRLVVVDLAVLDDQHRAVLVAHRLVAVGEIDDRQAPVAEGDRAVGLRPALVGPAVLERVEHRVQRPVVDRPAVEGHQSADPAHRATCRCRPRRPPPRRRCGG